MSTKPAATVISSYSELFKHLSYGFLRGFIDANRWWIPLRLFIRHAEVRLLAIKCIVLNGVLFLGSMLFFDNILIPLSRLFLSRMLYYYTTDPTIPHKTHLNTSIEHAFIIIYNLLWLYPIYVLSFGLNATWYNQMADTCFQLLIKPTSSSSHPPSSSYSSVIKSVSQQLYRILILLNYFLVSSLFYFIPIVGLCLSFIYLCWACSLYSFEYVWMHKGVPFIKRMRWIEEKWAYFLGFGFPCTLITFFFPSFVSQGIFALLFPMYIIMATKAVPYPKHPFYWPFKPTKKQQRRTSQTSLNNGLALGPKVSSRLPVFGLANQLALCCIKRMDE